MIARSSKSKRAGRKTAPGGKENCSRLLAVPMGLHGDPLEVAKRTVEDRAAGRLVDAAGLDPDESVFDDVDAPDAVLSTDPDPASAAWVNSLIDSAKSCSPNSPFWYM